MSGRGGDQLRDLCSGRDSRHNYVGRISSPDFLLQQLTDTDQTFESKLRPPKYELVDHAGVKIIVSANDTHGWDSSLPEPAARKKRRNNYIGNKDVRSVLSK